MRSARSIRRDAELFAALEPRTLLSGAFDTVGITALRADTNYAGIDGSGVGVAVIDTGLFSTHPDLAPNFVAWYDAVLRTENNSPFDPEGHGSHVAGTAASRNPNIGVATQARLIGIRGLPSENDAQPRHDTVAEALQWVLDNHAEFNIRVINMSLGTRQNFNSVPNDPSGEAALIRRLEQVGITVVTASGNSYGDFASPGAAAPAVFSSLSVASTWEDDGVGDSFPMVFGGSQFGPFEREGRRDRFSSFSQRSTLANQVVAPGQTIFSTWNGANGQNYNTINGTSMASPLVAGMVALMQDAARTFGGRYLSVSEVVSIVRSSADNIIDSAVSTNGRIRLSDESLLDLPETGLTFKRVNVYRAVQSVRELLTGTMNPGPVSGDADNTIAKSVNLGATDGSLNLGADGAIGTDGSIISGNGDVDLYRFTLSTRGTVSISLANTAGGIAFDPVLRLFNSAGTQIAINDNAGGGNLYSLISTESTILEPGTYYVGVSSSGNAAYAPSTGAGSVDGATAGDYRLVVAMSNPDPNGVATGAVAVSKLPAYFPGRLGSDLGNDVLLSDVDFFDVTAPDDGQLTIDVAAADIAPDGFDTLIRVFDTNLAEIAFNDDRVDGNLDPRLTVNLQKGQRVFVAVAEFVNRDFDVSDPFGRVGASIRGEYDLNFSFDNGDQSGSLFDATALTPGTLNGVVGTDGAGTVGDDGSKDVDFFEFTAAGDGVLDLLLTSPDGSLNPSLALWVYDDAAEDAMKLVESSGSSAALQAFVQAGGTYYISVTGQGNSDFDWFANATGTGGDTGNYRLTTTARSLDFARTHIDDSVNNHAPTPISINSQIAGNIGSDGSFLVGADDLDVYRFVAPATQRLIIRTSTSTEDSADTVLRVFDASGVELRFNDDVSANNLSSKVTITVTAGQTYYIGVNGYDTDARQYNVITGENASAGSTGTYALIITPAAAAEIELLGLNGTPIASGDLAVSNADGTRFAAAAVGAETSTREFTIFNSGNRTLQLTGAVRIQISGVNASEFTVLTQPGATVAKNGSVSFQVRFAPLAAGVRRAVATIVSNDPDESTYTFAISGNGVNRPEIDVRGQRNAATMPQSIGSGDSTPRLVDGTNFGATQFDLNIDRTFTIFNLGRKALNLRGTPRVALSGAGAGLFTVVTQPRNSIVRGGTAAFTIRYTGASLPETVTALVTILNNDVDEGAYTFTIRAATT